MALQVFHPQLGEDYIPLERKQFDMHANRGQLHRSRPHDIQLNPFTDASPATRYGNGGVGICYRGWLPGVGNNEMHSLCFVIREVRDSNECELVAIADTILLVCHLIKRSLQVLEENKWVVTVTIRSDSLSAMAFLRRPGDPYHPSKQRWFTVLGLIERVTSEVQIFSVQVRVRYSWMQALSVQSHRVADLLSKCPAVKIGTAIDSPAMAILYPDPSRAPVAICQQTHAIPSYSARDARALPQPKREGLAEGGKVEVASKKTQHAGQFLKRNARIDDTIDDDRPRKKMRHEDDHSRDYKCSEFSASLEALPPTSITKTSVPVVPNSAVGNEHAPTTENTMTDDQLMFIAIKHIDQMCQERDSLKIIQEQAEQLQDDQRAMMFDAIEKQLLANQRPTDGFSHFPNLLSIIKEAATKLSDHCRVDVQRAVEKQFDEYCTLGADEAMLKAQAQFAEFQERQSTG